MTGRPRLALSVAVILTAVGAASWVLMPREEDPRLAARFGMVVTTWPGASALDVERLVAEPLEDALAEVEAVRRVDAVCREDVVIANVELRASVADVDEAWRRVEVALREARRAFPAGVGEPALDRDLTQTEAVVLALTGTTDVRTLSRAADGLEDALLGHPDVVRVVRHGDPGRQVGVVYDDAALHRFSLSPEGLAAHLAGANTQVPAGSLRAGGGSLALAPNTELDDLDALRALPVPLPGGGAVPLDVLAAVALESRYPETTRARLDGQRAVLVGVVPRAGLDAVAFGRSLRLLVDDARVALAPLAVHEVAFQPDRVSARLDELGASLAVGVGIVALVLLLLMGPRLGLVIAAVVPAVTLSALAAWALGGGVLHQMAVAALVVSLGLVVDNAIVLAEDVQRRLDQGEAPRDASHAAVRTLGLPLAAATATTLASFVPMLLSAGTVGDFTRAIPIVITLALAVSYAFAIFVTPVLAARGLVARRAGAGAPRRASVVRAGAAIGRFAVRRPWLALGATLIVALSAGSAATRVGFAFFPESDRDQLVVTLELPRGAHLERTDAIVRRVEARLARDPVVRSVATTVGASAPFFYYNLPRAPRSPHLGTLLLRVDGPLVAAQERVRAVAGAAAPEALVVVRRLEQGPPVLAPVEVRVYGHDLGALAEAADRVMRTLRGTDGARDVRHTVADGVPVLELDVATVEAAARGLGAASVAATLLRNTRGVPVGTYRAEDDPLDIVLRTREADRVGVSRLGGILVPSGAALAGVDATTPLAHLVTEEVSLVPAEVRRRHRLRVASVLAEIAPGATPEGVVAALGPQLAGLELPAGTRWEWGGAIESSREANAELGSKAPFGILLLLLVLLWEFESFRRLAIVMMTAPLAMLGIWPGLLIADVPFGFVALLGAIALIGVVVNGAIVLIDVVDRRRREGLGFEEAIVEAVAIRTRPILLTTVTTIAGLAPLLFSRSTLWPPMAASMISGLIVATGLTLVMVPALCRLMLRRA